MCCSFLKLTRIRFQATCFVLAIVGVLHFSPSRHVRAWVPADLPSATQQDKSAAPRPPLGEGHRIEGHDKCIDCHKSEILAWRETAHANGAFDMLRSVDSAERVGEIAQNMGIPTKNIAKDSVCVYCHATPQIDHTGRQRIIAGVSCEACHGASGGDDGWLNRHAVYGPAGSRRDTETPDRYQKREEHCAQAGQNRVANAFRLARACFQCHLVWHEELVNVGEHSSGDDLEFVAWSMGEVRHNFHLDQNVNALVSTLWSDPLWRADGRPGEDVERVRIMYVAGQLAKLQVALTNRSQATEDGDFASDMEEFVDDAIGELEDIITDYSEDDEDEEKGYDADDLPSLQKAVDAVTNAIDSIDNVEASETEFQDIAALYGKAANEVEAAAEQFIQRHDGIDLGIVDDFAPELPALKEQDEGVVRGRAWEP